MKFAIHFFICLFVAFPLFAQSRASNTAVKSESRITTTATPRTSASGVQSFLPLPNGTAKSVDNCTKDAITVMFDAYCSNNVCADSLVMFNLITNSGVATSNASCKAIVYEEIGARLSYNYKMFKSECDLMNQRYTNTINDWSARYSQLEGGKSKAEKGKKTATAVAIGTSAVALGSGIYNVIQYKENKELETKNKDLNDMNNEEFQKKSKECQAKASVGELWVWNWASSDCKFDSCMDGFVAGKIAKCEKEAEGE